MLKRIFLFLLTNILVLIVISISFSIISSVFGINLGGYYNGGSLLPLLIFAGIIGFSGAFISLFMSKFMAKQAYQIELLLPENLYNFSSKQKHVYSIVEDLSNKNGIKIPEVGIYYDSEPNAFATGATKNSSLVAVSSGLLENMNEDEISGVIAHEMSHILNGDMVTMTLMQGVVNTFVVFLSRIIASIVENFLRSNDEESQEESTGPSFIYYVVSFICEILFSILASILVMKFSRYREFKADEGSARFVGREKMIKALQRLKTLSNNFTTTDDDKLATLKIGSKKRSGFMSLFASHPDLDERIEALQNLKI